mmetsp:Transcript_87194/g.222142  ORF Transcript_87194/g.222142 Transcript_87194/m.222142 type:complete len:235 (-) Transcript_87194:140-844(-)
MTFALHHGLCFDSPGRQAVPLVGQISERTKDLGHEQRGLHRRLDAELPVALRGHARRRWDDEGALRGRRRQHIRRSAPLLIEAARDLGEVLVIEDAWHVPCTLVLPQQVRKRALLGRSVCKQVVSDHVLRLQVLSVLNLDAQVYQLLNDRAIELCTLSDAFSQGHRQVVWQILLEPCMPSDLSKGDAPGGVHHQHLHNKVLRLGSEVPGQSEVAVLDLPEKIWHVLIVEGQRTT